METPRERQENELQALKAIFAHELKDLRGDDLWEPLHISITLTPQQGGSGQHEVHAQIDMVVHCNEKYPDEVPEIELLNSKGLSAQQVQELKSELEKLAKKQMGEVMIFELAQHVQKFLHIYNKPGFKSFYEEMLSQQNQQKQSQQLALKLKEDQQRLAMQGEVLRRQQALKEEQRLCRLQSKVHQLDDSSSSDLSPSEKLRNSTSRRRCQSTSDSSDGPLCEHRGSQLMQFSNRGERQIRRGRCLGHGCRGCVTYSAMDITTGELLVITEWALRFRRLITRKIAEGDSSELANYMKQISSIEQELNFLHKLRHPNLVHYLNMKYAQEKEGLNIYILQEFVLGSPLSFYLSENIPVDADMLRHCTVGILEALAFLHQNNVTHKDLRDTSVFVDKLGTIRVGDYSLDKRLSDVYQMSVNEKTENLYPSLGRGGKKYDIYRLGILVLSLAKGCLVTDVFPEVPGAFPPDLRDFLQRCLAKDEQSRWKATQLLDHQFVRSPLDRGLSPQRSLDDPKKLNNKETADEEPDSEAQVFLPTNFKGQSRIQNEFEVLKWLGKGAFGDVLKVRNKLDGGVYAIKRIELNPKNKQLNRKITREVKLLSRLNHENVVRYFNSWIESATIEPAVDATSIATTPASSHPRKCEAHKQLPLAQDFEGPGARDLGVEWSLSRGSAVHVEESSDESSDDDWISFLPRSESSDGVIFEGDGGGVNTSSSNTETKNSLGGGEDYPQEKGTTPDVKEVQFMYIQMEFCEKSTLRTAIDAGLYEDEDRVWRLFREIVEGLAHIHQQGMIHRDLKPVNIFLDSNDHVKIGDFGLATTNILSRPGTLAPPAEPHDTRSFSHDMGDGSMTGQVGTALYVSPELSSSSGKAIYNQKVDIYSLGIILFEMCYHPLETGMERVKVLANLRSKEVTLPPDMAEETKPQQVYVIRWLLNHDPSLRPTSQELLQSEYVPPPQVEEAELQEMVRHTLSNPQSKAYKHLVAACFNQEVTPAEDFTYDMNINKATNLVMLQEFAKDTVRRVFHRHGACSFSTPLLMPRNGVYGSVDSCALLMTHSGGVVSLPHDLRVGFARHVAWNSIAHLKRYSIDRVYREKKVFGFHPRELYECAMDIVTPSPGQHIAEAELMSVVWEVFCEFPTLRHKNCSFRVNHTLLLKAILLHCGIEAEKHGDIYSILSEARDEKYSKFQVHTRLISLCLTDQAIDTLFTLIEAECPVPKASGVFRVITRRKGEAASLAKQALKELETVANNTDALGIKCPIVVAPGLVFNVPQYSGLLFQFVCELKKKRRKGGLDVVAAGGRYDHLLSMFRQTLEMTGSIPREVSQSAAGVSISLDKIVSALQEHQQSCLPHGKTDVVLCSLGQRNLFKEKAKLARDMWSAGIRTLLVDGMQTLEEVQDFSREMLIPHIVMLKDTDTGTARIRTWEKDRFQERKIASLDLVEFLSRQLPDPPAVVRSDSKPDTQEVVVAGNSRLNVNLNFQVLDKLQPSAKRRYENQMKAHLYPLLGLLCPRVHLEVIALNLDSSVVRMLAAHLDLDQEHPDFRKMVQPVIERYTRHRDAITSVCEEIRALKMAKSKTVIVLYSLEDNVYKLIT